MLLLLLFPAYTWKALHMERRIKGGGLGVQPPASWRAQLRQGGQQPARFSERSEQDRRRLLDSRRSWVPEACITYENVNVWIRTFGNEKLQLGGEQHIRETTTSTPWFPLGGKLVPTFVEVEASKRPLEHISRGSASEDRHNIVLKRNGPHQVGRKYEKTPSGKGGLIASLHRCRIDQRRSQSASGMPGSTSTSVAVVRLR